MPTNQETLDAGSPAIPNPPAVTDAAIRYGNALAGVWGTEAEPTDYGSFLKGIPEVLTGLAIVGSQVVLPVPGRVTAVQITNGTSLGPATRRISGVLSASQYSVAYNATTGVATISFAVGQNECSVELVPIPQALIDHLNAEATP